MSASERLVVVDQVVHASPAGSSPRHRSDSRRRACRGDEARRGRCRCSAPLATSNIRAARPASDGLVQIVQMRWSISCAASASGATRKHGKELIELSLVRGIVSKSSGRQQQQGCKRQDETMGDGNGDAHTVISSSPLRFSSEQMAGRGLSYAQRHTLNERSHESHPSHDLDRAPPRGAVQPRRRGRRLGVSLPARCRPIPPRPMRRCPRGSRRRPGG